MKRAMQITCFIFLILFSLFLPGNGTAGPRRRYVTRAEVTLYQGSRERTSIYLQPGKISSILTYLRLTDPQGKVDCAPAIAGSHHYRIQLTYCDGTQAVRHLQDYRYFARSPQLWQRVSQTQAGLLYPLLLLLEPDA